MKPIYLTPSLARSLLDTYRQLQEKGADEDFSFEDFKRILLAFGKSLPDLQDKSLEAIIQYLEILAASRDEMDKAVMPPQLERMMQELEEYEKLRSIPKQQRTPDDESRLAIKTLTLKREIDRLEQKQQEVVYETTQTPKTEPGTQELDEWLRAQDLSRQRISLTRSLEEHGLPAQNAETIAKDAIAHIRENPEAFQGTLARFISGAIRQINPGLTPTAAQEAAEAASTAVLQTTRPTKEQNIFRIDQPLSPIRRTIYSPSQTENVEPRGIGVEKKEELPEAIKQLESSILLRTRRGPAWKKILDDFTSSLFGSSDKVQERHQAVFDQAISRLQIENPRFYSENFVSLQTIRNNLQNLFSTQVPLEQILVVPLENLKEAAQTLDRVADQLVTVTVDAKNNSVEKRGLTVVEIQRIIESRETQKVTQARETKETTYQPEAVLREISISAQPFGKNTVSNVAIKLSKVASFVFAPVLLDKLFSQLGNLARSGLGSTFSLVNPLGRGTLTLAARGLLALAGGIGGISGGVVAGAIITVLVVVFVISGTTIFQAQSNFLTQATSIGIIPESKYIGVIKFAEPSQLSNDQLPSEVKYTITITAKEARLEDLSFKDQFSVFSKGTPGTPISNVSSFDTAPLETGQSRTFSYNLRFEPDFKDSVVTNTFTVTADPVGGPKGETTSRSASIIIGNPPTSCFVFTGTWNNSEKARMIVHINKLAKSPAYISVLCGGGQPIFVERGGNPGFGGMVTGGNTIHMFDLAFSRGEGTLFYTVAHESGHVYGWRNRNVYKLFIDQAAPYLTKEWYIPTYTLEKSPDEDFAETIGVYIIRREVPFLSGHAISEMQTRWPLHYQFARDNIFRDLDGF